VRLLLVDDDELFLELLTLLLERAGDEFEVVGRATNGAEAVGQAAALSPDVIVMDVDLPVFDGIEAARLVHEREPETRVLLVSGSSFAVRAQEAHEALEAGTLAYLPKSRIAEDLIDTILALGAFGAKETVALAS
jgi:DNA-binding NarL/FixJ family response regulator